MKMTIDLDMTPEEGRRFFGLPDVQPMQEAMMAEVEKRMLATLQAMDPDQLMRTWLPAGIKNWEQMQKMFWDAMTGTKKSQG